MVKPEQPNCCSTSQQKAEPITSVIDPVCGMTINLANADLKTSYQGKTFYFCGPHCLNQFESTPEKFLNPKQLNPTPASNKQVGLYTCPMHPEIQQQGPGTCPICGMALEPLNVSLDNHADPELESMSRRFKFSTLLAGIVVILAMAQHIPGLPWPSFLSMQSTQWIELEINTPVVLWGGWPFFQRGWASIMNRHLNMFTLIAIGTGVAYAYRLF